MTRQRSPSRQTKLVLSVLTVRPSEWRYGYELIEETGLASGTLYPMLMRLCDQGLLESQWVPSSHRGKPPRHAYRLTAGGLDLAFAVADGTENPALGQQGHPA
jgi:PadR family transcriptional regulator, regulatory protein PadR